MDKRTLRRFPLDEDDVIQLYRSGKTAKEIQIKYGCSLHAVINCLKRTGVYAARGDWGSTLKIKTGLTPANLLEMYNSGMWKSAIATKIGISEGTVGRYLEKLGIPLAENRSEATRIVGQRGGFEWRTRNAEAAHDAVRGSTRSFESLARAAVTREKIGRFGSETEKVLASMLKERGLEVVPQKAFGKYNLDLAVGNVAVEVTGRSRKLQHIAGLKERIKEVLNSGYVMVWVWAGANFPVEGGAADYIASLYQQASVDPTLVGQYRVIRRDGKLIASGGPDDDDFPGIFSPVGGTFSRPGNESLP